jgi:putative phosphoribosyl transferase
VLAIPRGGVPVGYEVSRVLGCPLDVIVPRKLPIPWSPEAGFGAIMPDGTRVLNERMARQLGLAADEIAEIAEEVLDEVRRREAAFRGNRPPPAVAGRAAILIDDGLATGYTMIAAVRAVRKRGPSSVVVAVPVSPRDSANQVARDADEVLLRLAKYSDIAKSGKSRPEPGKNAPVHCNSYMRDSIVLHISDDYPFAVASFYQQFPDLTDEEVRGYLSPTMDG